MSHSENCQKVHINREGISPLKLLLERSRLSSWIRLGKLLGTDQLKLVSNDLKTGPDWPVQSIELSTGPLSGSVQLLSRKGLRTDIESVVEPDKLVVEPPNRMEPNSSVQLRIWVFGPKQALITNGLHTHSQPKLAWLLQLHSRPTLQH